MTQEIFSIIQKNDDPGESKSLNMREWMSKCMYYWPLFLLSVLIALTAAYFYLKIRTPQYEIKAKLLIKDETKIPYKEAPLKELELFKNNKVVENEIEILKSRRLLSQLVNNLQLFIDYKLIDGKSPQDLYGTSPVRFVSLSHKNRPAFQETFEVLIKSGQEYVVKRENGEMVMGRFNRYLKNALGVWKLESTANTKDFIGKTIQVAVSDPNEMADLYARKISIEVPNKKSTIIELSLKDALPQRGKDILDGLTELYTFYSRDEKSKIARSTLDFINTRLSSLTGELNAAEKNVEGYRQSQGLTDISSESKVFLENVQKNDNQLNEVNLQIKVLNGIEKYINAAENQGHAPATIGLSDPVLIGLVNQLIALQMEREKLLATTPETNPLFEPVNRQIQKTKAALKENIRGMKSSLLTSREQLQAYNAGFESAIKKIPNQERLLVNVKRQQSIKENLYVYLLEKREEISFSYASNLTESPTMDPAYTGKPSMPSKYLILMAALLFGLAFPVALIFGKDLLNNKVISRREIQQATSVPILSELVFEKDSSQILFKEQIANTILGEQFRMLRTNLRALYGDFPGGRVTMLTSSVSHEGKSFVARNLGISLAASGRKTVLLDLDLRKKTLSKTLRASSDWPGLTNYLQGEVSMEEIIQPAGAPGNLFIIRAGDADSASSELLEQALMDDLIKYLRYEFDDILFDTPPVHPVSDALILGRFSDVCLYLVRQGYTAVEELDFIKDLEQQKKLPRIHIIFNGIQSKGKYGYGAHYNSYYKDYVAYKPAMRQV